MAFTAKDVEFLAAMTLDQLGLILREALRELYQREENKPEQCALCIALIVVTEGVNEKTVGRLNAHMETVASLMKLSTAA
jgi:hypothetical protein